MADAPLRPRGWSPGALTHSPARLGIAAGAAMLAAITAWWSVQIALQALQVAVDWPVPRALAHGALMVFGFLPVFMAGFLFTAAPKWLRAAAIDPAALLPALALHGAGWVGWTAGVNMSAALATAGAVLAACALADFARRLLRLLLGAGPGAQRLHAMLLVGAFALGAACLVVLAIAMRAGRFDVARACVVTALWAFLAPAFVVAAHRLLPQFGVLDTLPGARQVGTGFALVLPAFALRALDPWMMALAALDAAWWNGVLALAQAIAGAAFLAVAAQWVRLRALRTPLVRALHLGTCWLAIACAVGAAGAAMRSVAGSAPSGLADVHALAIGAFCSIALGMVSRILAAQARRAIAIEGRGEALVLLLQAAAGLRLAAAGPWVAAGTFLLAAALAWAAALLPWCVRLLRDAGSPAAHPALSPT